MTSSGNMTKSLQNHQTSHIIDENKQLLNTWRQRLRAAAGLCAIVASYFYVNAQPLSSEYFTALFLLTLAALVFLGGERLESYFYGRTLKQLIESTFDAKSEKFPLRLIKKSKIFRHSLLPSVRHSYKITNPAVNLAILNVWKRMLNNQSRENSYIWKNHWRGYVLSTDILDTDADTLERCVEKFTDYPQCQFAIIDKKLLCLFPISQKHKMSFQRLDEIFLQIQTTVAMLSQIKNAG